MSTSGKIRMMLALLCASLLFTAIFVQKTYTPVNNLDETGKTLESNLQKKEKYITGVLDDSARFQQLKKLQNEPHLALDYIQEFTTERNVWFITVTDDQLSFWSGIKVIPDYPLSIKDGHSFLREPNGYYEAIKKTEGNFSAIFFIPVKLDYTLVNQYLQNVFASDLLKDNNIEIADFTDKNVYDVHSIDNDYLFSVKVKSGELNHTFFYYVLGIWMLTLISFCILVQNISVYISDKGYPIVSLVFMAGFIGGVRYLNLQYGWPDFTYKLSIFNPALYASSEAYPSLGDLCLNVLFICWFTVYLYTQRKKIIKNEPGRWMGYSIFVIGILVLIAVSTALQNLFLGLVINSKINFDVSNVLNLSSFSFLGVLMLCFSFFIFYLLAEVFLTVSFRLPISDTRKFYIFIAFILLSTVAWALFRQFSLFYILWSVLILIRARAYRYNSGKLEAGSVAAIILVCAFISSIKLNYFENIKEKDTRHALIEKLEVPNDENAVEVFKRIEHGIIADTSIVNYFRQRAYNSSYLKTRLQKLFFNAYLSKYEFKVYEFDKNDRPLTADNFGLGDFKSLVLYGSLKVSDFFYRENGSFGFMNYFAILPLAQNNEKLGTIVIELRSKPQLNSSSFPGLLIDGPIDNENDFKGYSYAFYSDGKLLSRSGAYVYNLRNTDLKGQLKKYVLKTTKADDGGLYSKFTTYSHLIYKPSDRNLIVVTRESNSLFFGITSITFFFVAFLAFAVLVIGATWLWRKIKILSITNDRIKWMFKINPDLILYKTRIQFSMVFAVVFTLLLVGVITFFSISAQYESQQDKAIKEKITSIVAAFETGAYNNYLNNVSESSQEDFDNFASRYSADLTLFDLNGVPLITTQPRIYENDLQARRMNARAYINLSELQKSEFVNNEIIGKLSYKAVYMPVRNDNETVAYLQLPYFSNEADYKERVGSLLNIMINVYALVFIAIGLFAVFIARRITAPLSFIQHSLSKTAYGKKNEPIKWDRNDEIGALVKEYNQMIAALEASAQKLAQSERESAWREMAKQVAHEIKNPLTPLKLGLQLLDKSWKDKDPKFDQKFEKFSKSFVEQIESLSSIASEFSAFAKMPETKLEQLNIFDVLSQAVTIFKEMDNIKIFYLPPDPPFFINADRDQLLRCFNNLLKNAIEAINTNKGQGIIEVNYVTTNKSILLTIKDNGEGIPDGLHEKIFQPNFTTKSSGTGLGLAFVKNSIENAGGKVWFETVQGNGTTFYLSLPAA